MSMAPSPTAGGRRDRGARSLDLCLHSWHTATDLLAPAAFFAVLVDHRNIERLNRQPHPYQPIPQPAATAAPAAVALPD
jgi:hypothetical protein